MKIYITFVTNYKFLYNFKLAFEESIPNSRDKISESSPNSIHFQDRIRLTEIFAFPHRGVKFLLLAFHKRGSISLSLSRFDHGELEIQHSLRFHPFVPPDRFSLPLVKAKNREGEVGEGRFVAGETAATELRNKPRALNRVRLDSRCTDTRDGNQMIPRNNCQSPLLPSVV